MVSGDVNNSARDELSSLYIDSIGVIELAISVASKALGVMVTVLSSPPC